MLLPKPNQAEFEIPPVGTFAARCYRFIDLGTQPKEFKGETKLVHVIRLSWELPMELMTKGDNDGKPFSVHQTYTWSMHEKATLRKTLESWRGKKFTDADFGEGGFDTHKLLGAPCMIGISHTEKNGKVYSNIASVSPLMKGFQMPEPFNPPFYFSFNDVAGLSSQEAAKVLETALTNLSKGTQDMLRRAPEYAKAIGSDGHVDDSDSMGHASQPIPDAAYAYSDDIPF